MSPIAILLIGMAAILVAIIVFRVNAFLALIGAAMLVSLLAPGDAAQKMSRVAEGFGRTAGHIGVAIALASIIGAAMAESGAADRIVRGFLSLLGEKRAALALAATAFILSLPVFFDTVFFLLAPLARSMYARTNRNYLKYLAVMSASGVATHTLVPPHPGPLAVAATLGVDLGVMILMGIVIALPAAAAGYAYAGWIDRRMPVPMRARPGLDDERLPDAAQPNLVLSLVPVVGPVLLISMATIVEALRVRDPSRAEAWASLSSITSLIGNPNFALFLAAAVAMWLYARHAKASRERIAAMVEKALMGAGVVIIIVAAGGAFGAMLQAARLGPAIQDMFLGTGEASGLKLLLIAFGITALLRIAQGSSTVSMITTAGMMAAMIQGVTLPFHPVYLACAIAAGAIPFSWMNDAGFWVFSRIGGVTETETLRSWTPLLTILGFTAMIVTVIMAHLFPFAS